MGSGGEWESHGVPGRGEQAISAWRVMRRYRWVGVADRPPLDRFLMEKAHLQPIPGQPTPALSAFLNGRSDLSGLMALRIEKAFGPADQPIPARAAGISIAESRR